MAVENEEPDTDQPQLREQLVSIMRYLTNFLDKGRWHPQTPLEDLVLRTLARSRGTYECIIDLVCAGRSLQAAMLGRSLFEDMAVVHWLVLNHADPDWLIQRFYDHAEAMQLHTQEVVAELGLAAEPVDVRNKERAAALAAEFGRFAQKDWWGQDRDGTRLTMPQLVNRIGNAPDFQPRLKGAVAVLEQYYQLQHKSWTQALHHTALGLDIVEGSKSNAFPTPVARAPWTEILFGNFWVFGQTITACLQLAAPQDTLDYFGKLFLAGLAVFGTAFGSPVDWEDQVVVWADEMRND